MVQARSLKLGSEEVMYEARSEMRAAVWLSVTATCAE